MKEPLLCENCKRHLYKSSRVVTGPFETREQLRTEVNLLHKKGFTGKQIAERLSISGPTVSRILHGDKKQETY